MSVPRLENRDQFHLMNPAEQVLIYYVVTESEAAYSKLKQWKMSKMYIGLVLYHDHRLVDLHSLRDSRSLYIPRSDV